MNPFLKATLAFGLLLLLLAPPAAAQAPQTLSFQGFLTDNNGAPLNANATLSFVLWTHPTSTNPADQVWTETHAGVPVADGLYNVSLGSNTSFTSQGIAFDQAYWLEITVNAGSGPVTLTPRTALQAVPYAFHAMNAGSAGSAWALTGNSGTTPGTNFLGTTDNTAFEVKVNGARALRLEPTAGVPNVVAGAASNAVTPGVVSATIGGGQDNSADGDLAVIGGGDTNTAGEGATVGGGQGNDAVGSGSTIGGGAANLATGLFGTIAGGGPSDVNDPLNTRNRATDDYGVIGGGGNNQAGDGDSDPTNAHYATVGGGQNNNANDIYTTVSGGQYNTATNWNATVGGGYFNTADGLMATVGGGSSNDALGDYANVAGGVANDAHNFATTVGGGNDNDATASGATIAGGQYNKATHYYAAIGGGVNNKASGIYAAIGGGEYNRITAQSATVGGGSYNLVTAAYATIAGGGPVIPSDSTTRNQVTDEYGAIGGGGNNRAGNGDSDPTNATYAAVGGGQGNVAAGLAATIPGGWANTAAGDYSFAAGCQAQANHNGALVWADSRTCTAFASQRDYQFRVRAWGGAQFDDEAGSWVEMLYGTGLIHASNGAFLSWGGTWTNASDVALKEHFQPVDPAAVLDEVIRLPIQTWRYKAEAAKAPHKAEDTEARHLGPTAQDFYAAFGLGTSDKAISTVDADGVALAAIQGLHALLVEKDARIEALQHQLDDLQAQVSLLLKERQP